MSQAPSTPTQPEPTAKQKARAQKAARKAARRKIDRLAIDFQPDAVEIEERPIPLGARWTLYTVVGLICATIAWACLTKVDRVVETTGRLVTTIDPIIIQPLQSAVVREVKVKFGDRVRRGDVLAVLDPTFSEAEVAKYQDGIQANQAALARLQAEHDDVDFSIAMDDPNPYLHNQRQLFLARKEEHNAKVAEIEAELGQVSAELETNRVSKRHSELKLEVLKRLEGKAQDLFERGVQSEAELLQAHLRVLEEESQLRLYTSKEKEYEQGLARLQERLGALNATRRAQIDEGIVEAQQNLGQLQEELAKAQRLAELGELIVPTSLPHDEYVVFEIAERTTGSVAQQDQPLIKLIPVDVPLEAEVEVAAKDIGFISIDDATRIKLEAFPYQKHGWLDGHVRTISEGSFTEDRGGMAVTFFRARVQIDNAARLTNAQMSDLMPGMSTSGEILIGERRVIEYVLYPLLKQLDNSAREP